MSLFLHGCMTFPQPLRSATPEVVAKHVGRTRVTDNSDEQQHAPAVAPKLPDFEVLRYMGTHTDL